MTINELQILLDINYDNKHNILKNITVITKFGYFFVDSEDGCCYLFDENGNLDDIRKIKLIDVSYINIKKDIEKIVIPDSVKIIGDNTFEYCEKLTSVNIPNSVRYIKKCAFYDCISLISINIPDSVKSIKAYAFTWCKKLTSITIPDSIEHIGYNVFIGCTNLKSLTFKNKTIDQVKFMKNYPFGLENESIIKCIN